tara:strand:+ start:256 stop:462 length:207 start_codon:yes stop_codon:yes gene_type:complete
MKNPKLNTEEVIKDLNNIMNLVNQVQNIDLEKDDLNKLEKIVVNVEKNIKEKYKDILKEDEDDLDSKK